MEDKWDELWDYVNEMAKDSNSAIAEIMGQDLPCLHNKLFGASEALREVLYKMLELEISENRERIEKLS